MHVMTQADTAKFKSIRTESGEQISRLESRCKQLQVSPSDHEI